MYVVIDVNPNPILSYYKHTNINCRNIPFFFKSLIAGLSIIANNEGLRFWEPEWSNPQTITFTPFELETISFCVSGQGEIISYYIGYTIDNFILG